MDPFSALGLLGRNRPHPGEPVEQSLQQDRWDLEGRAHPTENVLIAPLPKNFASDFASVSVLLKP